MPSRSAALSSTTSSRLRRGWAKSLMRDKRGFKPFGRGRLVEEREGAARQAVLAVLVQRDDLHRDVPRRRVLLQLAEHRPAQHVGQEHVERDRRRPVLAGQRQRLGAAHRHQHLEALVVGEIDHHAGVVGIVLDDQQHGCRRAAGSWRSSSTCSAGRSAQRAPPASAGDGARRSARRLGRRAARRRRHRSAAGRA